MRAETLLEDLWAEPTGRNTLQSKVSQLRRALGDRSWWRPGATGTRCWSDPPPGRRPRRRPGLAPRGGPARRGPGSGAEPARPRAWPCSAARCCPAPATGPRRTGPGWRRSGSGCSRTRWRRGSSWAAAAEVVARAGGAGRAEHPLREGLWVVAGHRAVPGRAPGRRARGVRAGCGRLLRDELGVEPGRGSARPGAAGARSRARPWAAAGRRSPLPGNLPAADAPLVGRDEDLAEVASALGEHGWSRSSARPGSARPGSRSRSARAARAAGRRLAGAAGRRRRRRPTWRRWWPRRCTCPGGDAGTARAAGRGRDGAAARQLRARRRGRRPDLVRGAARRGAARCGCWRPARSPLGLDDEHGPRPGAARRQRRVGRALRPAGAGELRSRFVLDADDGRGGRRASARALDGLPLAIELAAARVRSLSVRDIARRLDDRFALLRDPTSRRPERRRALAGAIGWSYDLLFPDDQRGLWALSVLRRRRLAGRRSSTCSPRSGVPAGAVAGHDRPAGRPLPGHASSTVERRCRALPAARQHPGVRRRAAARVRAGRRGRAPRTPSGTPRRAALVRRARPQRPSSPSCLAIARAERANVDVGAGLVRRARPRCSACGSRTASAGPGWCSATAPPARRGSATPSSTRTPARDAGDGAARSPAGWRPPPATSVWPRPTSTAPDAVAAGAGRRRAGRRRRPAPGIPGDPAGPSRPGARQQRRPPGGVPAPRAWPGGRPAACCSAAFGSLMLGDTAAADSRRDRGAATCCPAGRLVGAWCTARRCWAAIAQAEHRFADAARALAARGRRVRGAGFPRPGGAAPGQPRLGCSSGSATRRPRRRTCGRSTRPWPAATAGWPRPRG